MAARSQDLADANAFILTDEETLIPAAPPADEVTVTADRPTDQKKVVVLSDWAVTAKQEPSTNGSTVLQEESRFCETSQPLPEPMLLGLESDIEVASSGRANDNLVSLGYDYVLFLTFCKQMYQSHFHQPMPRKKTG